MEVLDSSWRSKLFRSFKVFSANSSGRSFYNFQEIAEDLIEMDILKIGNSAMELKDIWEQQLNSVQNKISEKTNQYLNDRQGSSIRAFEHLSL